MIHLDDLETDFRALIDQFDRHPRVTVAVGAKCVILYVVGHQLANLVESRIPTEYLAQVKVIVTRRVRPARRHEPIAKDRKKH